MNTANNIENKTLIEKHNQELDELLRAFMQKPEYCRSVGALFTQYLKEHTDAKELIERLEEIMRYYSNYIISDDENGGPDKGEAVMHLCCLKDLLCILKNDTYNLGL